MSTPVGAILCLTKADQAVDSLVENGVLRIVRPAGGKLYGYKVPFRVVAGGEDISTAFCVLKTGRCDPGRFEARIQEEHGVLCKYSDLVMPRQPRLSYQSEEDIGAEKAVATALGWRIGKAAKVSAWDRFVCGGRKSRVGWTELVLLSRERLDFIEARQGQKITQILADAAWPAMPPPPQGPLELVIDHPTAPGDPPVEPSRLRVSRQLGA